MAIGVIGGTSGLVAIKDGVDTLLTAPEPSAEVGGNNIPVFGIVSSNTPQYQISVYDSNLSLWAATSSSYQSTEFFQNYGASGTSGSSGGGYYIQGAGFNNVLGHKFFGGVIPSSPPQLHHRGNPGNAMNYEAHRSVGNIVSDTTATAHEVVIGCTTTGKMFLSRPSLNQINQELLYGNGATGEIRIDDVASILSDSANRTMVGASMCYNATKKILAFAESNSYNHYIRVFFNVDHPAEYLSNETPAKDWVDSFKNNTSLTSDIMPSPTTGGNEDLYRGVTIVSDTGRIFYMRQHTNWGHSITEVTVDIPNQTIGTPASVNTHSYTNVYGAFYNSTYGGGVQPQVSFDNRYVFLTSNSYYYMGGFAGNFIDTKTGSIIHNYYWDTSNSYTVIPVGKNAFIGHTSDNADSGNGVANCNIFTFRTQWAYATGSAYDETTLNQTVAVDGALPYSDGSTTNWLDVPYSSTNYPGIIPVFLSPEQKRRVGRLA